MKKIVICGSMVFSQAIVDAKKELETRDFEVVLPDGVEQRHLRHTMTVPVERSGDTRLYVRVTQLDGHRAWSSPIYLFR